MNWAGAAAASSSSGSQACAACKYQRRKCGSNCLLAPFFPSSRQKDFLNAHKLFGVSNIMKMIKKIEQSKREIAVNFMVFEANARAGDPIGGCYRIICELQRQIKYLEAELELVRGQISICCSQQIAMAAINPNPNFYHLQNRVKKIEMGENLNAWQEMDLGKIDMDASSSNNLVGLFDEESKNLAQNRGKEYGHPIKLEQEQDLKGAPSKFSLTNRKR